MLNELLTVNRIKKGDIKAFENVFRKYYAPLYFYSLSIIGQKDVAEEITQELFYVIWRDRETIEISRSLKSYLYKSIYHQTLKYIEHHKVRKRYQDYVLSNENGTSTSTPELEIEYKELQEVINKTVDRLPQRRKRVFIMHRVEHLKYKEIAQTLAISLKTVEAEMTKAYKTLREEVERYMQTS